jgi:hypothetical protein
LVHNMVIWYTISHFGTIYQEKSGNPDPVSIYNRYWKRQQFRFRF